MKNASKHAAPRRGNSVSPVLMAVLIALIAVLVFLVYKSHTAVSPAENVPTLPGTQAGQTQTAPVQISQGEGNSDAPEALLPGEESFTETPSGTPASQPARLMEFDPVHTAETDPKNFISETAIQSEGRILGTEESSHFSLPEPIDFGYGEDYTGVQGIVTFRGNNFRDGGSYGLANLTEYKFGEAWSVDTGTLTYNGEVWTGSGWVGQPLIVKWPRSTKAVMNMYDWAKEDDDLVEVIYATMDGNIYFLDLETGKATRDRLFLGYTFKGAGALDPRGYPILYLGSGYDSERGRSRAFIISLLDYEVLYTFGPDDAGSFSLRGYLSYFDGSALVDAETDQLIYPGENGILYIIKLNTEYDEAAGTLQIDPQSVKWRYNGVTATAEKYWLGMEDSAVIWRSHLIVADNGGRLMCLDLNTLTLDWVQDILDDSNGSPVLSMEDGHPYIYISTSFHYGWRSWTTAPIPIFKIDAENGEIVWRTDYECHTEQGVSGGVQSTIALGKGALEGRIYVTVARTPDGSNGVLACLNRNTGEIFWEHKSYYTWSSPVLIYNADGSGCVLYCNYNRRMFLLDGITGEELDTFDIGGGAEASPAVYENTVVIGIRQYKIWGVKIK